MFLLHTLDLHVTPPCSLLQQARQKSHKLEDLHEKELTVDSAEKSIFVCMSLGLVIGHAQPIIALTKVILQDLIQW